MGAAAGAERPGARARRSRSSAARAAAAVGCAALLLAGVLAHRGHRLGPSHAEGTSSSGAARAAVRTATAFDGALAARSGTLGRASARPAVGEVEGPLLVRDSREYLAAACAGGDGRAGLPLGAAQRAAVCAHAGADPQASAQAGDAPAQAGTRCRPDIVLAGSTKCGSSSLFAALTRRFGAAAGGGGGGGGRADGAVLIEPLRKEQPFFTRADREASPYFGTETNASDVAVRYLSALLLPRSMQARERPPRGRPASAHPVRGQAQLTIDGQVRTLQAGRRAARTAAAFCPDTKVVLILCEPASRAHRHYSFRAFGKGIFAAQKAKYANQTFDLLVERQLQELPPEVVELRRALLSSPDDEEAIARAERAAAESLDAVDSRDTTTFLTLGLYAAAMRPWLDVFPSRSFCVTSLGRFAADQEAVVDEIGRCVGLSAAAGPRVRGGGGPRERAIHRNPNPDKSDASAHAFAALREFYAPFDARLDAVLGDPVAQEWRAAAAAGAASFL